MKSYIVTYKTQNGDLKERRIEARNHLAAAKAMKSDGCEVVTVVRDDDGGQSYRLRKRVIRVIKSLIFCIIVASVCVAFFWWRYHRG